jgi:hypothetical protein
VQRGQVGVRADEQAMNQLPCVDINKVHTHLQQTRRKVDAATVRVPWLDVVNE